MTSSRRSQGAAQRKVTHRASAPIWHRWRRLPIGPPRRPWQWVAVCAAVTIVALATLYVTGNGHAVPGTGAPSALASPTPPVTNHVAPPHRSSSSNTPEAALAAVRLPRHLATALTKWNAGPGGSAFADVSNDLGSAMQDAGIRLYDPMRLACVSLAAAVAAAKAAPPIPDASMQGSYDRALVLLATGAADCKAGISVYPYGDEDVKTYENPALLHLSVSAFAAGARDFYQATVDIHVVHARDTRP
jgi:hypothetical protein